MAESLASNSSETTEAKKEKSETKAKAKPAKKKAPASNKSGFSVKDFWAEKLNAEAPGATLPR